MITTFILIFVPCLLIYLAFELNLGRRLLDAWESWLLNISPRAEWASNDEKRMPGMATFLCSWLIPFSLLVIYKHWFEGTGLEIGKVILDGLILACAAGVGLLISRIKHQKMNKKGKKALSGNAENADVFTRNSVEKR